MSSHPSTTASALSTPDLDARAARWARAQHWVGQGVDAIDTPALVLDLDALKRNLDAMATFARQAGVKLRPHAKMHKSADIARLQLARGAVGFCVQKTSEAEALAAQGITNLYISNEVIAPGKLARVAALAAHLQQAGGRLAIAVDSPLGVARLAQAVDAVMVPGPGDLIDVLVELDVGQGRCGVANPADVVPLAQAVQAHRRLRFAGIQAYHGGAQHLRSPAARREAIAAATARVRAALAELATAGVACPLVTGAGTGTFEHEAASGVWGELQAGSYAVLDRDYADNLAGADPAAEASAKSAPGSLAAPGFEHALFVKSRVVSRQAAQAVLDAGHKSHAIDSGLPGVWDPVQGLLGLQHPSGGSQPDHAGAWTVANGGDEHTKLLATPGARPLPNLGDTVWLVPGHCDPTVNLHDFYVGVQGGLDAGTVACVWPVHARGCID
jgi:D-serine deaminase-like pyridoxal phosphate-dependent protein